MPFCKYMHVSTQDPSSTRHRDLQVTYMLSGKVHLMMVIWRACPLHRATEAEENAEVLFLRNVEIS